MARGRRRKLIQIESIRMKEYIEQSHGASSNPRGSRRRTTVTSEAISKCATESREKAKVIQTTVRTFSVVMKNVIIQINKSNKFV